MKKLIAFISAFVFVNVISVNSSSSQSVWQWQEPQPTGNAMNAVSFVNEKTGYAAGNVGTV
ncbi:MAG: hypothetical protein JSS91_13445, partial [Bacteroidetes bacterium]|nr:hypothetical protein [Bacteroidota bacterium]